MEESLIIKNLDELETFAESILKKSSLKKFALYGDLGAGKTAFVKKVVKVLGGKDIVTSPTFSILNIYETPAGRVYHFDFYRINDLEEVYDLGYEDYFFDENYVFVEWPEKIKTLIDKYFTRIYINLLPNQCRKIDVC